jgi:nucleotide-binding universal stress UspA family protein
MEEFRKIFVPLDGSDCAENVFPQLEILAKDLKATISLLRVAYAHTFPGADPTNAEVKVVREAEEYLKKIEDRLKAKGFNVDTHVRYGMDADEILDHASQKEIDMEADDPWTERSERFLLEVSLRKSCAIHPSPSFWFGM